MPADFAFDMAGVRVQVACGISEVARGLRAEWAPCLEPIRPALKEVRLDIRTPNEVRLDGQLFEQPSPGRLLVSADRALYRGMGGWLENDTRLHAALLVRDGIPVVLAAPSGTGKSSFARAALGRGWHYASDDQALFDGKALWGLSRTIQFDPVPANDPAPAFLAGCDLHSYRFLDGYGAAMALPLFPVPPEQVWRATLPAERAILVFLERSAKTALHALPAGEALRRTYEAAGSVTPSRPDPGKLARPGRVFHMCFNAAEKGLSALEEALGKQLIG